MPIINHTTRQIFALPGIEHQTLASAADQLEQLEVWMQTLAAGAATPAHFHECEEVIVALQGVGSLTAAGKTTSFTAGTTVIIPPREIHQLVNSGAEELQLLVVMSETPARVFAADGTPLSFPWS